MYSYPYVNLLNEFIFVIQAKAEGPRSSCEAGSGADQLVGIIS